LEKPEGVFHDSIPGENGVGLRFRAKFFDASRHHHHHHEHLHSRGQQQEVAGKSKMMEAV